jgi:hypothetical protein
MKITRQSDISESYKITCDWLDQFANSLAKEANLEYLDTADRLNIQDNATRFRTIEAKMDDIKKRIGFEALMASREEVKTASVDCGCGGPSKDACACEIKTASQRDRADVEAMRQVLVYIRDLIKHESHLDPASVINRCREEDGLHFRDLPINLDKLSKFIESELSKSEEGSDIRYIPPEPVETGDSEDTKADYYQHAEPSV